jgi:hypothetical protein
MTLAKCPACNHDVSREAKTCPNCGQPLFFPRPSKHIWLKIVLSLLVVAVIAFIASILFVEPLSNSEKACLLDWSKCTDNEQMVNYFGGWSRAQDACKDAANRRALYSTPVWPHNYFTFYFSRSEAYDYVKSGTAILIEHDAQFQNEYGAMEHKRVECAYDLRAQKVAEVFLLSPDRGEP